MKKSMVRSNSMAIINVDFSEVESFFTIKTYLHSIIYNLVSNGIKYRSTDRAPVITITSFKNENNIGLVISDNGLGLDIDDAVDCRSQGGR